jgi:CubicO group peptidase (beta-lactamase class C family)
VTITLMVCTLAAPRPSAAQDSLTPAQAAAVDSVFAAYAVGGAPGCSMGIVNAGRVRYAKGYGLASLELDVPLSPRSVFDIGSTSKQFTAASVALLALDGKLSLDDDVRKYIPELPDLGARVTIRHLLNHTSGWRDYTDLMSLAEWDDRDHTTDREALEPLARQRALNFPPGATWRYSNTGYFLAGLVVRRVSGKTLGEFARERIFEPLGMRDTRYLDDTRLVVPRRATGYAPGDSGRYRVAMSDWEQVGDGAVQTTVEDLARWDANFDDPRVGGPKLVEMLQTRGRLADGRPLSYALGLTLDQYRGVPRVQHGGAWAGYRAMLMRFPTRGFTVVTLCNRGDANTMALSERVADVLLGPVAPPAHAVAVAAPAAVAAAELAPLAGTYRSGDVGIMLRFTVRGDTLLAGVGPRAIALAPLGGGRFRNPVSGGMLAFTSSAGAWRLTTRAGEGPDTALVNTLDRVEDARPLSAADLAAFAGRYASAEAGAEFDLSVRDGRLVLHGRRGDDVPLRPLFADGFGGPAAPPLRFVRDASGRVVAFTVSTRGVSNLRFTRQEGR